MPSTFVGIETALRGLNASQQAQLFHNIAAAMDGVPNHIIERQLAHFTKADPAYGAGVRAELAKKGHRLAAE